MERKCLKLQPISFFIKNQLVRERREADGPTLYTEKVNLNLTKEVELHDIHFDPIKSLINPAAIQSMKMLAIEAPNPLSMMNKNATNSEPKKRPTKWGAEHEKVF